MDSGFRRNDEPIRAFPKYDSVATANEISWRPEQLSGRSHFAAWKWADLLGPVRVVRFVPVVQGMRWMAP